MWAALADPILPIFAAMAVGFALARLGVMRADQAGAINALVFYLAAPALVFSIVAATDLNALDFSSLGIYLGAELAIYVAVATLARKAFARPLGEAILLGMAASFANHVFFVHPIAVELYGATAAQPIAGVILLDALVFCGSVVAVDLAAGSGGARAGRALLRNPFVYAPILGLAAAFAGPAAVPSGITTFAGFAGGAAAPASLFALGLVLASAPLRPGPMLAAVVTAKLVLHPLLVWLGLTALTGAATHTLVLTAAGPCGAMAFVIATQYGQPSQTIARAVLVSTALSLFTLAWLA